MQITVFPIIQHFHPTNCTECYIFKSSIVETFLEGSVVLSYFTTLKILKRKSFDRI